jgi:hypothetical protein
VEHHRSRVLAAAGGGLDVLVGPSAGASRRPLGQGLENVSEDLRVMAAGSSSDVGTGGGGSWGWMARRVAHLLCWGQDGLGVEGPGGSQDAAHDKKAVDADGCAVVFWAVGGRWRGGGVSGSSTYMKRATYSRVEPNGYPFVPFSVESNARIGQPAMKPLHALGDEAAGPGGVTSFVAGALREISAGLCRGNFFMYRACLGMQSPVGRGSGRA